MEKVARCGIQPLRVAGLVENGLVQKDVIGLWYVHQSVNFVSGGWTYAELQ